MRARTPALVDYHETCYIYGLRARVVTGQGESPDPSPKQGTKVSSPRYIAGVSTGDLDEEQSSFHMHT